MAEAHAIKLRYISRASMDAVVELSGGEEVDDEAEEAKYDDVVGTCLRQPPTVHDEGSRDRLGVKRT